MPLRLHAITPVDTGDASATGTHTIGGEGANGTPTVLVPFRDLAAVVSDQKAFALEEPTAAFVDRHRAIVDSLFRHGPVLPAPAGVVFRTQDVLTRWMELHYVSLTDALEFVEDRVAARVYIVRADGKREDLEAGSDLAAAGAEAVRALRRRAVGAVPLRTEHVTGIVLSASFLIERELWKEFLSAVEEQQDAHHLLRFDVTGPWAPYDFVRMQFGG